MATLVFTAVGQALGGPMGAALGSIIGQSIDQGLFGPAPRKGPRLGDLTVQTSSYGSMIPRIYGTMRVAGTVIWSTDLIEEETVEGGGKGAPAGTAYKYSVSLAVALSSRPIIRVGRVWADGKLIRGASGDLKVATKFRVLDGGEDQELDPLIASIETIDQSPAYRGCALAIFEGLELAEFGNRIPQLTFEISADDGTIELGGIAIDVSDGLIAGAGATTTVDGYAAYGSSSRDALACLVDAGGLVLMDDGQAITASPSLELIAVADEELGCSADGPVQRLEWRREAGITLSALTMSYYDPARDYQTGHARALSGEADQRDERYELPAAMAADTAKAVAESLIARRLANADGMTIRLPPSYMGLLPGHQVAVGQCGHWQVERLSVDGLAIVAELVRPRVDVADRPSDSGRATLGADLAIGGTTVALIEPANVPGMGPLLIAASNTGLWKSVPVEIAVNGIASKAVSVHRKARLGVAISALSAGPTTVFDRMNSLAIRLVDPSQQLFHADVDGLAAGLNLAMVGDELIQFASAQSLGNGEWRLSTLLRGQRGTEWATGLHLAGEPFCVLDQAVAAAGVDGVLPSSTVTATAHGVTDENPFPIATRTYQANSLRPPSPCRLAASLDGAELKLQWVDRRWSGFGWPDSSDQVDGEYRVSVDSQGLNWTGRMLGTSASIAIGLLPGTGSRTLSVAVSKIADGTESKPTLIEIGI